MPSLPEQPRPVVVWGNCQAGPIAELLERPLTRAGLRIVHLPPVYLIDEAGLDQVRQTLADASYLISQPISDNYRLAGCGTEQLAARLGPSGRLITLPVAFHIGAFPYQVNAHGGDGARVNAPSTDYHDLRAVVAAERGLTVDDALDWWPEPDQTVVAELSAASLERLRVREKTTDIAVSDLVETPTATWTITHPTNATLAAVAERLLAELAIEEPVHVPEREFLGARRAPLEPAVLRAHSCPADAARPDWTVDGQRLPLRMLLETQLAFYRQRPDIVADTRSRYAERLAVLGL